PRGRPGRVGSAVVDRAGALRGGWKTGARRGGLPSPRLLPAKPLEQKPDKDEDRARKDENDDHVLVVPHPPGDQGPRGPQERAHGDQGGVPDEGSERGVEGETGQAHADQPSWHRD